MVEIDQNNISFQPKCMCVSMVTPF